MDLIILFACNYFLIRPEKIVLFQNQYHPYYFFFFFGEGGSDKWWSEHSIKITNLNCKTFYIHIYVRY